MTTAAPIPTPCASSPAHGSESSGAPGSNARPTIPTAITPRTSSQLDVDTESLMLLAGRFSPHPVPPVFADTNTDSQRPETTQFFSERVLRPRARAPRLSAGARTRSQPMPHFPRGSARRSPQTAKIKGQISRHNLPCHEYRASTGAPRAMPGTHNKERRRPLGAALLHKKSGN